MLWSGKQIFFWKKSKNALILLLEVWKFKEIKNPKILDPHKCENPENNFFWKNPKILEFHCVEVWKVQKNWKIQKSLIFTHMKIRETNFFWKNPKILEFHCMKVKKFQEIKKSKNPWSSQVWKSVKEIIFWKNPKILDSVRCYNLTKKIVQRKNPKILEFDANNEIVQFLNKSKILESKRCNFLWTKKLSKDKKSKNPWNGCKGWNCQSFKKS